MNKRVSIAGAAILLSFAVVLAASPQKSTPPAAADSGTGTIAGTVKDHHGVPVGGAGVTAMNISTHQMRSGATDGTGSFSFEGLPEGEYQVTASARDLLAKTDRVRVKDHHVSTVHFKLKVNLGPTGAPK